MGEAGKEAVRLLEEKKIIALFFERSEQAIRELDNRYGKILCNFLYHFPAKKGRTNRHLRAF